MSLLDVPTLAREAYAAYNDTLNDTALILWDDLSVDEQFAWAAAIQRVLDMLHTPEATP